ncbi:DUF2834 domain-containing protein [Synechococcus sp. RSCCF101]|uniref:DUF2834 domain-containing protein n=1 Tax=Synechococcus sp. RSCCF101 TaxID=2511069 RepID=UPI00124918BF|nr:DUF2834 domain-containing protein [Synechococcus sp. RSCCF101]QEY32938.1 DUF2834 domain-containing protein [Synechococcus sp. RSCCF101]
MTPPPESVSAGTPEGRFNGSVFRQITYLVLCVAGLILPWKANLEFIQEYGAAFDITLFISLANVNAAARSLSSDLLVGSSAVLIWIVHEGRRLKMRSLPLVLLSAVTIAFAFAAPLFLFLRERRLQQLASGEEPAQQAT